MYLPIILCLKIGKLKSQPDQDVTKRYLNLETFNKLIGKYFKAQNVVLVSNMFEPQYSKGNSIYKISLLKMSNNVFPTRKHLIRPERS